MYLLYIPHILNDISTMVSLSPGDLESVLALFRDHLDVDNSNFKVQAIVIVNSVLLGNAGIGN